MVHHLLSSMHVFVSADTQGSNTGQSNYCKYPPNDMDCPFFCAPSQIFITKDTETSTSNGDLRMEVTRTERTDSDLQFDLK